MRSRPAVQKFRARISLDATDTEPIAYDDLECQEQTESVRRSAGTICIQSSSFITSPCMFGPPTLSASCSRSTRGKFMALAAFCVGSIDIPDVRGSSSEQGLPCQSVGRGSIPDRRHNAPPASCSSDLTLIPLCMMCSTDLQDKIMRATRLNLGLSGQRWL